MNPLRTTKRLIYVINFGMRFDRLGIAAVVVFLSFFCSPISLIGQVENDLPEEFGSVLGIFKLNQFDYSFQDIPEFRDFDSFLLQTLPDENIRDPRVDENGRVQLSGRVTLKNGMVFEFERAYVVRLENGQFKNIYFETRTVEGINYKFCGEFLENRILDSGGGDTDVGGVLSKSVDGKEVARRTMPFIDWAVE